ncbi:hypothetical protein [Cytophaga aurantiaca]|uniref:hypothetical protein n=1 Tax=Cytophaga aurantiaca TaxID=29530 RepID=UPI00036BB506|nr:hypothetical protein [Cytophaga aurantiaca]
MSTKNYEWSFSSVGGVKRVNFDSGKDILALEHLDQKLWTVLSCPTSGLEIDAATLELIDNDNDGHIKVVEMLAAIKWIGSIIHNPDDLMKQDTVFPLSAINEDTAEGKILMASAKNILKNLGRPDATTLTVEETSDRVKIFNGTAFNGDGIITEDSTPTDELKALLKDIITCMGSLTDRGGKEGIDTEFLNIFLEQCTAYSEWYKKSEDNKSTILPFNENTELSYQTYLAVKSKIDDYFLRCRLAAFDPETTTVLNLLTARVEVITAKDLTTCLEEIETFPLAKIEGQKELPLHQGINPAWEDKINQLKTHITNHLFPNKKTLSESEWNSISEKFQAYEVWKSEKAGHQVEALGLEQIRKVLSSTISVQLFDLIEKDKALETEANNIILVDKLVRYYRDLFTLIKNFVTFYDFYSPDHTAIFQSGTLYIDQRSCDLCIKVSDMAKHDMMVSLSGMFLIYCKCVSKSTGETIIIVAALTNGDIDNLIVGRNAVFYDRKGVAYDATIVKIVENPISIIQAFWSPYRKVSRFVEKQVNKFASEQDNKVLTDVTTKIETVPAKVETPTAAAAPPVPFDVGKFVGIFAAIGLALGAIGTALASVIAGFMGLTWWKMPLAISGLLLLISGPAMIMAFFKLRQRNLALILDANGWAVNAKVIVNIPFGNTLTQIAALPKHAKINTNDPFSSKGRPLWQVMLFFLILIGLGLYAAWRLGWIVLHM